MKPGKEGWNDVLIVADGAPVFLLLDPDGHYIGRMASMHGGRADTGGKRWRAYEVARNKKSRLQDSRDTFKSLHKPLYLALHHVGSLDQKEFCARQSYSC